MNIFSRIIIFLNGKTRLYVIISKFEKFKAMGDNGTVKMSGQIPKNYIERKKLIFFIIASL
jgi:hypothetical protein